MYTKNQMKELRRLARLMEKRNKKEKEQEMADYKLREYLKSEK